MADGAAKGDGVSQKRWWRAWSRLGVHVFKRDWLLVSADLEDLYDEFPLFFWALLTAGFAAWSLAVSLSHVPLPSHNSLPSRDQQLVIWAVNHPWWTAVIGGVTALVAAGCTEVDSLAFSVASRGMVLAIDALAFALMLVAINHGYPAFWLVLPFAGLFGCSMIVVLLTMVLLLISWPGR